MTVLRGVARIAAMLLLLTAALGAIGYRDARADPVVRRLVVTLPKWPVAAPPDLWLLTLGP